jgi:hypothetical protein
MEHSKTSWRLAFALAILAIYGPFIAIGILGFPGDAQCRARWWQYMPVLPGLAPGQVMLTAPQMQIAGIPLRRFQPTFVSSAWRQFSSAVQAGPAWVRLLIAAALVLLFILVLTVMFRQFPPRGTVRGMIFGGGLVCAGLLAGLTYAMFLA